MAISSLCLYVCQGISSSSPMYYVNFSSYLFDYEEEIYISSIQICFWINQTKCVIQLNLLDIAVQLAMRARSFKNGNKIYVYFYINLILKHWISSNNRTKMVENMEDKIKIKNWESTIIVTGSIFCHTYLPWVLFLLSF